MVGTTDCVKSTGRPGKKVSKPLMEKKRRARINKCLDQLKSLLENYYTSNIRKRKLEKADILELTVKHLRNLQKIKCCTTNASEVSDFQAGFSSCLATVGQYLSMADNFSGSDRWMLSHLPRKLTEGPSTVDSDTGKPAAQEAAKQRLLPPTYGPETRRTPTHVPFAGCLTRAPHPARSEVRPTEVKGGRQCLGTKSAHAALNSPEQKACGVFRQRNQVSSFEHNVWRPW